MFTVFCRSGRSVACVTVLLLMSSGWQLIAGSMLTSTRDSTEVSTVATEPVVGARGLDEAWVVSAADSAGSKEGDYDDFDDYAAVKVWDPFEPVNRAVFRFNDVFYKRVLRPAVRVYEFVVRPPLNRAIGNAYENLRYPIRFVNSLLQAKFERAGLETAKFALNSTLGFAGFFRYADRHEALARLPAEDFGQTLGVWGVPHGPYLVLPFAGGFSARDGLGRAADYVTGPTGWSIPEWGGREWIGELDWEWRATINVTEGMSFAPGVLDLYEKMEGSAVDPYLSVRDAIRRNRDAETAR